MATSKWGTKYSEGERHVTAIALDRYGLNYVAFWGMIESYIQKIHPLPVKWIWEPPKVDIVMGPRAKSQGVELYLYAVGNVTTTYHGNPEKLDQTFTRLFMQSYYRNMRPLPVSFQIMDAIEIHLRTPGVSDGDHLNPLREIFNPTT